MKSVVTILMITAACLASVPSFAELAGDKPKVMSNGTGYDTTQVVQNKEAVDDLVNAKPINLIGPPDKEKDESDVKTDPPYLIGPPTPILPPQSDVPFGGIVFPKVDATYFDKQTGKQVNIVSSETSLTITLNSPPKPVITHHKGRVPTLDTSVSYSLDLKTGELVVVACLEVCKSKTLTLGANPKEYLETLKFMKEKVDGTPRPLFPTNDLLGRSDIAKLSRALAKIIEIVEKQIAADDVCEKDELGCDAREAGGDMEAVGAEVKSKPIALDGGPVKRHCDEKDANCKE